MNGLMFVNRVTWSTMASVSRERITFKVSTDPPVSPPWSCLRPPPRVKPEPSAQRSELLGHKVTCFPTSSPSPLLFSVRPGCQLQEMVFASVPVIFSTGQLRVAVQSHRVLCPLHYLPWLLLRRADNSSLSSISSKAVSNCWMSTRFLNLAASLMA